ERMKGARIPDLPARLEALLGDLPSEDERIARLLAERRRGLDQAGPLTARGAEVFQKICANCHRVGGKGARIGPDLDGIGLRGADRLLEDVLLPSRNVDQAFRATTVVFTSGRTLSGLVLRREGETLVIADETGKEHRAAGSEIEEQRTLKVS